MIFGVVWNYISLQSFEFFSLGVYFKVQILHTKLYRNVCYVLGFTTTLTFLQEIWYAKFVSRYKFCSRNRTLKFGAMLKNGQTYFKNPTVFTPQDFYSIFFHFSKFLLEGWKPILYKMLKLITKANIRHIYKYLQLLI